MRIGVRNLVGKGLQKREKTFFRKSILLVVNFQFYWTSNNIAIVIIRAMSHDSSVGITTRYELND
jgi:hypothetical protein